MMFGMREKKIWGYQKKIVLKIILRILILSKNRDE